MKFIYNSAFNILLNGLKLSLLAILIIIIAGCGNGKKDGHKKKKAICGGVESSNGACFEKPDSDEISFILINSYGATLLCTGIEMSIDSISAQAQSTFSEVVMPNGNAVEHTFKINKIEELLNANYGDTIYVNPVCYDANDNPINNLTTWSVLLKGGETAEIKITQ